jgi:GNAT superfamily N-acetyltransferase
VSALRPLTLDDAPGLAAIAVERRWRPHLEAWRIALTLGTGFAVELDEGLAAAAVLMRYGDRAAVLSVLTSPRYTGQGLGRRVAEAALGHAGRAVVEMHAPPGGVAFAARLGFRPVGSSTRYVGRPVSVLRPDGAASLRPVSGSDFPAVVAIDEVAWGALRRPLIEALFPFAVRACLAVAGGRTVGYGVAWGDADELAVGPIVAEEDATAAAMVAWLVGAGDREVRVDVPDERTGSASAALAAGLAPRGRITRLVLGAAPGGRRDRLHALAAPWAG